MFSHRSRLDINTTSSSFFYSTFFLYQCDKENLYKQEEGKEQN